MSLPAGFSPFREELEEELRSVTDWWLEHVVDLDGETLAGEVSNDNRVNPDAGWSLVYVSRLLWFFSAVHRRDPRPACHAAADVCRNFLERYFTDREHGGYFWTLDPRKHPESRKKQGYGQAFAVYGLSEYAMAFGDESALALASEGIGQLERHARDSRHGGYIEALDESWQPLADVRLGKDDLNAEKTMNSHLHLLEAYTHRYRARPDAALHSLLHDLLDLFLRRFQEPWGDHLLQYCRRDWTPFPAGRSFGHDIESGWLMCEAADLLGDDQLQARARQAALALADGVLAHGVDADGAVINERTADGTVDPSRIWWVQAEALVGFFNAWQISGKPRYLDACMGVWAFISAQQRDRVHGEWTWYARSDSPCPGAYKAGAWKGPYHNGRALLDLLGRLDRDPGDQGR